MNDTEIIEERMRRACIEAALRAYEEAGISGICAEGRWECAVEAMRTASMEKIVPPEPRNDTIMNNTPSTDWDPGSTNVLLDPCAAYGEMREQCPVAYSEPRQWTLFRHEDVARVLHDHATFSNAVSTHLAVPNGMDPPEHTEYRAIIERYFCPEEMARFEPKCRNIAGGLTQALLDRVEIEFISDFAQAFAVRAQCAFLGWPPKMHEALRLWMQKNHEATLSKDRGAMQELAREFEAYIDDMLRVRRQPGAEAAEDVTARLMRETVYGRPLNDRELVSIFRNWTVGEIGTIAAAIGILAHFLANDLDLQDRLRKKPALLPNAIDEMLRIRGPLAANRRITTCPVEIGGRKIGAGERISMNWLAANRDGRVFEDAETIKLDRDPKLNLLYGAGIHVCPGAPLASMEMRVAIEYLLAHSQRIEPMPGSRSMLAKFPACGFSLLPLLIR